MLNSPKPNMFPHHFHLILFNEVYTFRGSWMNPCDLLPFDFLDMFFALWNRCASPSLLNSTSVKKDSVCALYFYDDQSFFLVCFYNLGSWAFQWINSEFWLPLCRLSHLVTCLKHCKDFLFSPFLSFINSFFLIILFYCFMCPGVLFVCMHEQHICAIPSEVIRGHQIPWDWIYTSLSATVYVLRINPGPLKQQPILLKTEILLLTHKDFFHCNGSLIISLLIQFFFLRVYKCHTTVCPLMPSLHMQSDFPYQGPLDV